MRQTANITYKKNNRLVTDMLYTTVIYFSYEINAFSAGI